MKSLGKAKEDYLREIYLMEQKGTLSSSNIAKRFRISKAAVALMLRKLKDQGLITLQRYKKPKLTKKGKRIAKNLTFKHRVLETFLLRIGVKKQRIHKEAHALEHAITLSTAKKLHSYIGSPKYDPHGEKII